MRYSLTWDDPNDHLYTVTIAFTAPADDPVLHLPSWRPGRYLIQNYAANVREWSANMTKVDKAAWRVEGRAGEEVTVSYRYYAGVLDAGSSFLSDEEAYFNGSNLFMWVDLLREEPCSLTIGAPAEWQIESQLAPSFHARDYDHLIDSPTICAPRMTRHTFAECGTTFHLIVLNDDRIDTQQFLDPLRAIIRAQTDVFGTLPCSEYRFLCHVGDRWHGVEHEDSCSMIVKRMPLLGAKPGDEGYDHFLSLASHELFHLWNVKRIVPARFVPYDYRIETPTRLLWIMEGLTSYYGDLSLRRAGVWDDAKYLEHLRKEIETLENAPGRRILSLAQASFDGWLAEPAHMHDRANAAVNFYNKGEIVSALLDRAIRARSGKSLDDVMRWLWNEYGATRRGLEEDGFERAAKAATGLDLSDFFAKYVDGVEPLPYEEFFSFERTAESEKLTLGAKLKGSVIESVTRGAAAMAAGLLPGDELIAIDGTRVHSDEDVERVLASLHEGDSVEVLIARAGVVRTQSLVPRRDGRVKIKLTSETS
jgi:predicted metalloprotease with PDZ domain